MTRVALNTQTKRKKLLLLVVAVVTSGWVYLWYFGLPPYYGLTFIYPGNPDKRLVTKIEGLMSGIRKQHPDPTLQAKVREIAGSWSHIAKRPGLALYCLGPSLGALPHLEEMTRSDDPSERLMAYGMLLDFNVTGTRASGGEPTNRHKDWDHKGRYVSPIWERALYDPLPAVRRLAIKHVDLGSDGIKVYRRMLRDPDSTVRIAATRRLMGRKYNRPDLVPKWLQHQAVHGEYE
jgi:hypothetical protein